MDRSTATETQNLKEARKAGKPAGDPRKPTNNSENPKTKNPENPDLRGFCIKALTRTRQTATMALSRNRAKQPPPMGPHFAVTSSQTIATPPSCA